MIACLEEIAYLKGWINKETVREIGLGMQKNSYGKYLIDLSNKEIDKDPARILLEQEK